MSRETAAMKVIFLLAALVIINCAVLDSVSGKSRILLVPGLLASQLKAKVSTGSSFCKTSMWSLHPYSLYWVSLRRAPCLEYLKLRFNQATKRFHNRHGVQVAVPGFGKTKSVECLSDSFLLCLLKPAQYLKKFVNFFVRKRYKKGKDIRAAPYDWRLSPGELRIEGYFARVKKLIENMYNGKGVTIVAHSYGGLNMLYFLNHVVSQRWKNKYIKAFVPLGAPFGGATKIVGALISGELPVDINTKFIPSFILKYFRNIIRTFASVYFLTPRPDAFGSRVIVETPTTKYTARDYQKLFRDLKHTIGWRKYQATLATNADCNNPGVSTYCMYGTGVRTAQRYVFGSKFPSHRPKTIFGDGDGSVNRFSLDVCRKWSKAVQRFPGIDHMKIVQSNKVLDAIYKIVTSK